MCTCSTVNAWRSADTVGAAVTFHLSEAGPLWFLSFCTWGSYSTSFQALSIASLTLETVRYRYKLCGCFCGVLENLHGVPMPHRMTSSHSAFPKLYTAFCVCVCHKIREIMFQGSHMARLRLKAYGEFQGSHMACLCLKAYGEFLFVLSSSLPMVFIL